MQREILSPVIMSICCTYCLYMMLNLQYHATEEAAEAVTTAIRRRWQERQKRSLRLSESDGRDGRSGHHVYHSKRPSATFWAAFDAGIGCYNLSATILLYLFACGRC